MIKNTLILGQAAVALATCGLLTTGAQAQSATSKPVGYVTQTLKAGKYNHIGLTLHESILVSGTATGVSGSVVTDSSNDFTSVLEEGTVYLLEITSGAMAGEIQDFNTWTATTITTPTNLASLGMATGDTFQIRKAMTVADVFGENNETGLLADSTGNISKPDLVYIPDGQGGFTRVFYYSGSPGAGWYDTAFTPASDMPMINADSFLVLRRGATDLDLVVSGTVKTDASVLYLQGNDAHNYVGGFYPAGTTLANSGLGAQLTSTATGNVSQADVVYLPMASGDGYDRFIYFDDGNGNKAWLNVNGLAVADDEAITAGFIIQRRGAGTTVKVSPPESYSDL